MNTNKQGHEDRRHPQYGGPSQLTTDEISFLNDLIDKGRAPAIEGEVAAVDVTIRVQGRQRSSGAIEPGFVIAELVSGSSRRINVGVAKRNNDDDEPDEARGRRIALARAARGEAVVV